jgi:hypothetical protein
LGPNFSLDFIVILWSSLKGFDFKAIISIESHIGIFCHKLGKLFGFSNFCHLNLNITATPQEFFNRCNGSRHSTWTDNFINPWSKMISFCLQLVLKESVKGWSAIWILHSSVYSRQLFDVGSDSLYVDI